MIYILSFGASLERNQKYCGWASLLQYKEHKKIITGSMLEGSSRAGLRVAIMEALKELKDTRIPIEIWTNEVAQVKDVNQAVERYDYFLKYYDNEKLKSHEFFQNYYAPMCKFKRKFNMTAVLKHKKDLEIVRVLANQEAQKLKARDNNQ